MDRTHTRMACVSCCEREPTHRKHDGPDHPVPLVDAALDVGCRLGSQRVGNVDASLRRERRLLGLADGRVEEQKHLLERDLVHGINARQLEEQRVEQRASHGDRPVLLPRLAQPLARRLRVLEPRRHFQRARLDTLQLVDQAAVLENVAVRLGQLAQHLRLNGVERALVDRDLVR
eukprot:6172711-Pleurochrysis_carterae.AAC.3